MNLDEKPTPAANDERVVGWLLKGATTATAGARTGSARTPGGSIGLMSFLSRMMGIPDESGPPDRTADGRPRAEFNLGLLPKPDGQVLGEVQRKQMIAAIKAYREQSGAGLAEAKQVVDAIARGDRLVSGTAQAKSSRARPVASRGADPQAHLINS